MTLPTLHDNGTPARMLAASAEAAYDALQAAYELLRQTVPNGRDFYPQPDEAFEKAIEEHNDRRLKIWAVMEDLETLIGHCEKKLGYTCPRKELP